MKYIPVIDKKHPLGDGIQKIYRFANNYGASVVQSYGSYTDNDKEWELAVIHFDSPDNDSYRLTYTTPITDDVIGHLSVQQVNRILARIEKLL